MLKKIDADVTDTNHRSRGKMQIEAEFANGWPLKVIHGGVRYFRTGKRGTNLDTGLPTVELASSGDRRIWISADGGTVWED